MEPSRQLLLVSGSLRMGSTNTAALRTLAAVAPAGTQCVLYEGLAALPHFNPDDDTEPLDPAVTHLRAAIDAADAVVFSTPEYAGTLPGSFKNLLDWSVGGGEIYGKPVSWVNVSAPTRGAGSHASLRTVLGYVGARIVEDACAQVEVQRHMVGSDGTVTDDAVRARLAELVVALVGATSA